VGDPTPAGLKRKKRQQNLGSHKNCSQYRRMKRVSCTRTESDKSHAATHDKIPTSLCRCPTPSTGCSTTKPILIPWGNKNSMTTKQVINRMLKLNDCITIAESSHN
jgi:hypothetical protein